MTSIDRRPCGWLLTAGLPVFMAGAGLWRPASFPAPGVADVLLSIGQHRSIWLWIHVWLAVGVVLTTVGLSAWVEIQRTAGESTLTPIGVSLFTMGALLWLVAIAVRVTVADWAAQEALRGVVPD